MSTITVAPYRLNLDGSVSASGTAASALDVSWTDYLPELPGAGSISFRNDDPFLDTLALDGRDLLQLKIDGVPAAVLVPDPMKVVSIAQGEDKDEITELSGPLLMGLVDRLRVYPGNGVGALPKPSERFYNWTDPTFDFSGYPAAQEIMDVGTAKVSWPEPWAADYPLDICEIIWMDNPGGNPSTSAEADEGTCRGWYGFTAPEEGIYRAFVASDNTCILYIDSVIVLTSDSFVTTQQADFSMSAGSHVLAFEAHNGAWLSGLDSGPGGVSISIALVTLAGPTLLLYSFDGFKMQAYEDDPPGFTVGHALTVWKTEAENRGVLAALGLTLDFDETNDSNGNAWDVVPDIAVPVNTSGVDFLRLLSPYAEFRMDPDLSSGLVLHAYRPGELEMGAASGVTLARGVNLEGQEHSRENLPTTALLLEGADRWLERTDTAGIGAHGRNESGLSVGSPASIAEAYRQADAVLDGFAHPREQIDAVVYGAGSVPYVDILLGQTAVVTDSTGVADDERFVGVGVTQRDRRAVFACAFREVVLGDDERLVRMATA